MKVIFDKSFSKSLDKLKDKTLFKKIKDTIISCENALDIKNVPNVKKLTGFRNYYRIKIGNYRIGVELEGSEILRFITVLHRKDIYKKFP